MRDKTEENASFEIELLKFGRRTLPTRLRKLMLWYRLSSVFIASHRHHQAQIDGVAIPASVCESEESKLHGA